MAAGFAVDKGALDSRVASLVVNLRDAFDSVARVKTWVDGKTDAELLALGYTTDEVALVKSSITDLDALRKVGVGQGTQSQANDFFFFARRLIGLN